MRNTSRPAGEPPRRNRFVLPDPQAVSRRLTAGESRRSVARSLGVRGETLAFALARAGYGLSGLMLAPAAAAYTSEDDRVILSGLPDAEVARRLGRTANAVYNRRKLLGRPAEARADQAVGRGERFTILTADAVPCGEGAEEAERVLAWHPPADDPGFQVVMRKIAFRRSIEARAR